MSYLLDLVKSFDENELTQFKKLDVIGKEALIRDAYANNLLVKKFDETALPTKYSLTKSHFDKINSVLLAKTIQQFWGNDYLKIFSNVQNKGLIPLLFHQIKIQEKKLLKTGNALQITAFHKAAFDILRAMYHPSYHSKLTHEFGKKYLKSLGSKKRFEDEARVEMLALNGDILEAYFGGNEITFKPLAERKLNDWRKKIAAQKNPVANVFFGFASASFYKYFSNNPTKYVEQNEFALKAFYAAKGKVEKRYEGVLLSETAYSYVAVNEFAKALELYDKVMVQFPDTIGAHVYHQTVYFATAVICRNYEKAHRIFDEKLRVRIRPDTYKNMIFEMCALGLCLALHEKNITAATDWFKQLTAIQHKDVTPLGRVMIRFYETAYFYFSGDKKTALRLSAKHLDTMKRQPEHATVYSFQFRFIDCINKFIKYTNGNVRLHETIDKLISELDTGIYSLQNMLLVEEWKQIKQPY